MTALFLFPFPFFSLLATWLFEKGKQVVQVKVVLVCLFCLADVSVQNQHGYANRNFRIFLVEL